MILNSKVLKTEDMVEDVELAGGALDGLDVESLTELGRLRVSLDDEITIDEDKSA